MRLLTFSITNFRSITTGHKIPIGDSTVLLGKNNEGKSNVLRALSIAMRALIAHAGDKSDRDFVSYDQANEQRYSWRRDFPISLQDRSKGLESIFRLEFELQEAEIEEFRGHVKSTLNGTLPIEIKFGSKNIAQIQVKKQGKGGPALSGKSAQIARYVAERIQFIYIPAVRTEDEAMKVVQEMLSYELSELETNEEYKKAIQKIIEIQQPVLDNVGKSIASCLQEFLPNIKSVKVKIPALARRIALRSQCKIEIDDGSNTLLEYKGDGVKSLAALGLLKDRKRHGGASIVAIEEPESHLHPGAMHSLRDVISTLSRDNQVVITTHSPLFVDRAAVSRNILIDGNTAKPAVDIEAVRRLLGVRASDNLVNASHVLVVEGAEDHVALSALLPYLSPVIAKALKHHHLVIEPIGGSGNLPYKLTTLSNALCVVHVLLDNDDAGRKAFDIAESDRIVRTADVNFVTCVGMPDSELEDVFARDAYKDKVLQEFGVDLTATSFRGKGKWSDRMKKSFEAQGKIWNDKAKTQVKAVVAEAVISRLDDALHPEKRKCIDALVTALERKLQARLSAAE
jgi:putative ATP-dependent endonuclease of the OLD family